MEIQQSKTFKRPLPYDIAGLFTITAKPFVRIGDAGEMIFTECLAMDRQGNIYACYTSRPVAKILKITPDLTVSDFYCSSDSIMTSIVFHQDGRIFIADIKGKVLILTKDGQLMKETITEYNGEYLQPDELVFDMEGNLYFTDARGNADNPVGGIYRMDVAKDYQESVPVISGVAYANGLSFSPDYNVLWFSESGRNNIYRYEINPYFMPPFCRKFLVYTGTGIEFPNSNKVDCKGNLYQAYVHGGRLLVFDYFGTPIANVVTENRDDHLFTTNLIFKPGTDEVFMSSCGPAGAWIHKFHAFAKAPVLFGD